MSQEASTLIFVGGVAAIIGGWALCDAAEGKYAAAARAYSVGLPPSASHDDRPQEPPEPTSETPPPLPPVELK
jgi:hypothetical protein